MTDETPLADNAADEYLKAFQERSAKRRELAGLPAEDDQDGPPPVQDMSGQPTTQYVVHGDAPFHEVMDSMIAAGESGVFELKRVSGSHTIITRLEQ